MICCSAIDTLRCICESCLDWCWWWGCAPSHKAGLGKLIFGNACMLLNAFLAENTWNFPQDNTRHISQHAFCANLWSPGDCYAGQEVVNKQAVRLAGQPKFSLFACASHLWHAGQILHKGYELTSSIELACSNGAWGNGQGSVSLEKAVTPTETCRGLEMHQLEALTGSADRGLQPQQQEWGDSDVIPLRADTPGQSQRGESFLLRTSPQEFEPPICLGGHVQAGRCQAGGGSSRAGKDAEVAPEGLIRSIPQNSGAFEGTFGVLTSMTMTCSNAFHALISTEIHWILQRVDKPNVWS